MRLQRDSLRGIVGAKLEGGGCHKAEMEGRGLKF